MLVVVLLEWLILGLNNKRNMNKKDKIIILKAKVVKLKEKLKKAERTCAKQDNEIDRLKKEIVSKKLTENYHQNHFKNESKIEFRGLDTPIESTQELFEPIQKEIPTYEVKLDESYGVDNVLFTDKSQHPIFPFPPLTPPTKGRVYFLDGAINRKCYAIGVTEKDQAVLFSTDIKDAKKYNSFEEFEKEYEGMLHSHLHYLFEPIEK
jgi:hypothetical protein